MAIYAVVAMAASAQAIPPRPPGRKYLYVSNESTNQSIAIAFDMPAALNTAGCFTIASGENLTWSRPEGNIDPGAINIIASANGTQVTIEEF